MKAINPALIGPAQLAATSISLDEYPEWDSGTTYADKARVLKSAADGLSVRAFESTIGGNVGHDPVGPDVDEWIDVGPANRWAMFDQAVGTLSTGTGTIDVSIVPGSVSALAVIDTDAEEVQVIMTVSGTPIYDQTKSTNAGGAMIADWYTYFTAEVGKVSTLLFENLPLYPSGSIQVIITGADPGGSVSVGTLLVGRMIDLGMTEAGATVGITDFSRKVTNDFGATSVVQRAWAKRMTVRSLMSTAQVDNTQRRLAALRAKPALYIGEDGFDCLTVYGFYKDFSIDLALEGSSYCSATIEGLI